MTDDFCAGLIVGADCAARALLGVADQVVHLALFNVRQDVIAAYASLGSENATALADAFVNAVIGRRAEFQSVEHQGRRH